MTWAWSLCALALALDAGVLSLMLGLHPSVAQLIAVLMAHAAACLLFSIGLIRLLPEKFRKPAFAAGLIQV